MFILSHMENRFDKKFRYLSKCEGEKYMIEFHYAVVCQCDVMTDEKCWGEFIVSLEETETKAMAIEYLTKTGWDIEEPACTCPWCNKGIEKEKDNGLRRVK